MNNGYTTRGRSIAAGIAAFAVTTLLVNALVESFDPLTLLRVTAPATDVVATLEARRADPAIGLA